MKNGFYAMMLLATAGAANASIIPTLVTGPTDTGNGDFSWVYDATLASDQAVLSGNYFTIYDINGFTGTGTVPSDWDVTTAFIGQTPSDVLPLDRSNLINVTFTYTGPTLNYGGNPTEVDLGSFEIFSTISQSTALGAFTAFATKNTGPSRGTSVSTIGTLTGPAVPEPGTWALMIAGFSMVGWSIRRRRAAAVAA